MARIDDMPVIFKQQKVSQANYLKWSKEIEMWPTFMTPQKSFNPRTTYQDAFINKEFGEIKKIFQVKYDIFHCSGNFKHSNGQKLQKI